MNDGTRLIFWIDLAILLILTVLILMGQWDFVIALFIALLLLNYFDRWFSRRQPRP
jgi:membrane protein implicated in regulation of membrane protease activity